MAAAVEPARNLAEMENGDQSMIWLSNDRPWAHIGGRVEMFEDVTGKLDFAHVAASGNFHPVNGTIINRGFTTSVIWVRFHLARDQVADSRWFLQVPHPVLDHVTLFSPAPSGG